MQVIREVMSGGFFSYQGNQQRATYLTAPLIRTITSWDLGQEHRKISPAHRVQLNQVLVRQGMDREQENGRLWGEPDHTP